MFWRSTTLHAHRVVMSTMAIVFLFAATPVLAQSGPFGPLSGSWSGNGIVKMTDGGSERIKCKTIYEVADSSAVTLRMTCASDTYKISLSGTLKERNGAIVGSWSESTRNVEGSLSGRASGNQIFLSTSGIIAASLTLTTTGNRQTALLQPQGAKIRSVSITLTREEVTGN